MSKSLQDLNLNSTKAQSKETISNEADASQNDPNLIKEAKIVSPGLSPINFDSSAMK